MKILYLLADPTWHASHRATGYSTHVGEVVAALQRAGHSVEMVDARALRQRANHGGDASGEAKPSGIGSTLARSLPPGLRAIGRDVLYLRHNRPVASWLRRRLAHGGVDLIYERFHHMQWAGVEVAREHGIPIFLEFNAGQDEIVAHQSPGLVRLGRRIERRIVSRADRVLAVSGVLRDKLIANGCRGESIVVQHNGVDVDVFHPDRDGSAPRGALGAGPEQVVVGFVGSLAPWHGVDTLIEAVCGLPADAGVRLAILGGASDPERLEQIRRRLRASGREDSVRVLGSVPHESVPSWIAAFDIAAMPWTNEYGSPLKIFEYMAAGRAIVAPDRPVIREILSDHDDALLVPHDAPALAAAILRLARDADLRRRLGRNARAHAEARHRWDRHVTLIERMFAEVVESKRSPSTRPAHSGQVGSGVVPRSSR